MSYHNSDRYPPHSRLYIIFDHKNVSEQYLEQLFSEYGYIDDTKVLKDRKTGQLTGKAYFQYKKTSHAAKALDELNGKSLPNTYRCLKVYVASDPSEIQNQEYGTDRYKRLFVSVSKSSVNSDLENYFNKFGKVQYAEVVRDHDTGISKGVAFINFQTFLGAALAFEQCDSHYKAQFADPKVNNRMPSNAFEKNIKNIAHTPFNMKTSITGLLDVQPGGYNRILVLCNPYLTQHLVKMLFDIVPGLIDCQYVADLMQNQGRGTVTYSNPVSAAYAVKKYNNFEYPPGNKIYVKPDMWSKCDTPYNHNVTSAIDNLRDAMDTAQTTPDLARLSDAIRQASKLVKSLTGTAEMDSSKDLNYCSVELPPVQPLANIDSPVAKRCFLVCKPQPPSLNVLRDVFCRFGNLIDVYTLYNKTIGYALYAAEESANNARMTLHGAEICGVRMKVIEAEEDDRIKNKRRRTDDN